VRRFGRVAADLAARLLAAAVRIGWSGFELPTAPMARATAAVTALGSAWTRRHGLVPAWRIAALVTGGTFLASNASSPLASPTVSPVMGGTPRPTSGGDPWRAIPPKPSPSGDTT
jgi:hypothetical protein